MKSRKHLNSGPSGKSAAPRLPIPPRSVLAPLVGVVTLAAQPLALSTELSGRTTAFMVAQIRPQVGGIVQQRAFTEGALVKAGVLLYQIDAASYQATHASAKASVARAEATVNAARLKAQRQAGLVAIEAISAQDHEDAQASLQQAEADLRELREKSRQVGVMGVFQHLTDDQLEAMAKIVN